MTSRSELAWQGSDAGGWWGTFRGRVVARVAPHGPRWRVERWTGSTWTPARHGFETSEAARAHAERHLAHIVRAIYDALDRDGFSQRRR